MTKSVGHYNMILKPQIRKSRLNPKRLNQWLNFDNKIVVLKTFNLNALLLYFCRSNDKKLF